MRDIDPTPFDMTIEIILGAVALATTIVFGIVAAVQTHRATKFSKLAARAEGTFAKSDIKILLFGEEVRNVILAAPITKGRLLKIKLPFRIANTSDQKTAHEVEILIRLPKLLSQVDFGCSTVSKTKGSIVSETETLQRIEIQIESIHPEQKYDLPLPACLVRETVAQLNIPDLKTKDGVLVDAKFYLDYEYRLDFVIMQRDQKPIVADFGVTIFDCSGQTVEGILAAANARFRMRQIPLRKKTDRVEPFLLVEYKAEDVVRGTDLPVDEIRTEALLTLCHGVVTDRGYIYFPRTPTRNG
jgi:hypothetical protein